MTPKEKIRNIIKDKIKNLFSKEISLEKFAIEIEEPDEKKFGDYSTPVALKLSKILKKNPIEIGNRIAEILNQESFNFFSKIEVLPPGFINLFLSKNFLIEELKNIYEKKERYGADELPKEKIIIEFVSANPTGPLNVVNARAASVGDTIAKVLKFLGKDVFKEYYINDAGNQVLILGKSLLFRLKELQGEKLEFDNDFYKGEYIIEIAKEILNNKKLCDKIFSLNIDEQIKFLSKYAIEKIVESQKKDLKDFGVEFDNWFSEAKLRETELPNECYKILESKGLIYEKDGKIYFKSTLFGDEKDRVLIREDKTPTYFFIDIAYHYSKHKRGFSKIIDFWGPDHYGYIKRMEGAIKALGIDENNFTIKIIQQVNLIEGERKIDMSKREGKFIPMSDLIKKVGKDAAKFFFLHRSLESHLDFDVNLALKQCEENPVYYVQYAHARISSIFQKAIKKNISLELNPKEINFDLLKNPEEILLIKHLIKFSDMLKDLSEKFQTSIITNYLLELATKFHKFYTENRVLTDDFETTKARLFLIYCTKIILKIGLDLTGISAPEKM